MSLPEEEFLTHLLPIIFQYLKARHQTSLEQELSQMEILIEQINRQLKRALELRTIESHEVNEVHDESHEVHEDSEENHRPYEIAFSDLSSEFQDFLAMDLGYSGVPALAEQLGSQKKHIAVTHLPVSPEWTSYKEF